MTLKELKTRAENAGFKYAYNNFKKATAPPHLVAHIVNSDNFGADNKVYSEIYNCQLELTSIIKDLELEKKIKKQILHDVFWDMSENYISSEEVFNTSYFFNIKEEN